MKPKLSIVIPCYNCQDTLEEAVESCFVQGLDNFEVVMVDDGSTDDTKDMMQRLADRYSEIKLFYHEENKGGGATRNTGIRNAKGELIFCLDSDNILDSHSLSKMINFLLEQKVDGVAFYERRFFHSQDKKFYTSHFNTIFNKKITIDNIFDGSGILLDNFLYTKESFLKTCQYPEHHGFDTQCFEMRYLFVGNSVLICPDTFFYHRQNHRKESYFEREFNRGIFSINYFLSIEDIWSIFSSFAKNEILKYDIFRYSSLQKNLSTKLQSLYLEKKLFSSQEGQGVCDNYSPYDDFILNYKQKNNAEAFNVCKKILENGLTYKTIYFALFRSSVGLSGVSSPFVERETINLLEGLTIKPRILNRWYHRNLVMIKVLKVIQKIWKN